MCYLVQRFETNVKSVLSQYIFIIIIIVVIVVVVVVVVAAAAAGGFIAPVSAILNAISNYLKQVNMYYIRQINNVNTTSVFLNV